jgi:hypothetical protein
MIEPMIVYKISEKAAQLWSSWFDQSVAALGSVFYLRRDSSLGWKTWSRLIRLLRIITRNNIQTALRLRRRGLPQIRMRS